MAPVSIDDLIASLKSNGIGQEANDLAAVKAHLSQTLGQQATPNGYTPTYTSNTPQGTPVTACPPMNAPWDTRAKRRRSQSRGFDMAIDEEEEPASMGHPAGADRWRNPQRKQMHGHSQSDSFGGPHGFPPMSPISSTAPPLSPPASPTRPLHGHQHHGSIPSMPIPANASYAHPHDPTASYAASSDPFLAQQQMQHQQGSFPGQPYYKPFYPQSPPMGMNDPYAPAAWNPAANAWPAHYGQPVPVAQGHPDNGSGRR